MITLDAIICALIFLRVLTYRRAGAQHRPVAAAAAYLIAVAAGSETLLAMLGQMPPPSIFSIALHVILLLALIASRGNVVELFHTSEAENRLYRAIRASRRTPHAH